MRTLEAKLKGEGIRLAVVVSRFNHPVTERLLEGCLARLRELSCEDVDVRWVPGAFELPLVVRTAVETGRYDAVVALGAVIRGETAHFDYVCNAVTTGLGRLSLEAGIPVAFGVLTTENAEQALKRASRPDEGGSNKGAEAADVALEMTGLLRVLKRGS